MRDYLKDLRELEDIKSGRKFYIEDREYNQIYSTLPILARHLTSTKFCIISNTNEHKDCERGVRLWSYANY